jgi:DNA ligase-3
VADTVRYYFGKSNKVKPANESTLTLDEVDAYLDRLTEITKENDQLKCLEEIVKKCTKNDLQAFIRFIKKDLRIDAGASVLLDAINPKAYAAYQVSNNLKDVIERSNQESKSGLKKDLSIKVNLMTV